MNSLDLVNEVLAVEDTFRRATLEQTLAAARVRRVRRRVVRLSGVAAFLMLCTLFFHTRTDPRKYQASRNPDWIIQSESLRPDQIISTRPGQLAIVATQGHSFAVVETTPGLYKNLDDEGLLALTRKHPAALVRTGLHKVELLFLHPADNDGFSVD